MMVFKCLLLLVLFLKLCNGVYVQQNSSLVAAGMPMPQHSSFNAVSASDCMWSKPTQTKNINFFDQKEQDGNLDVVKLHLKHRSPGQKIHLLDSTSRDLTRIQTLYTRIVEKKNQNVVARQTRDDSVVSAAAPSSASYVDAVSPNGQLVMTLESGVSVGSGEYFMDVFIGTPPKHFSLILDTGSDLNWIQCVPCYDCFEQVGPHYDPKQSSSFRNISCNDPRCHLVSSPDPPQPCRIEDDSQTCPYFYWYGDSSNTTGDFAVETFTVNLTDISGKSVFKTVENVMFGCGHWNRGLFHGAAGLLGLGRGPLSFSSQLQSLYGHSFSYCLVDRNSNVSSKLIFGEDKGLLSHPELNFTSFVAGKENPTDTFYYVRIRSIIVGGEVLDIPEQTWDLSSEGAGGTIVDSGTTLSYFADPAYKKIKEAFIRQVKGYPVVEDFPILTPCYNVSGVDKVELPSFGIAFCDGAVWNFPVENYFIKLEPEEVVCLAILGTPRSALSIIGNYQQQNFHIMYDTKKSRLGFAPRKCADV